MLHIDPSAYGPPDRIKLLATGIALSPLVRALEAHPELWDQNRGRTESPESPHHEASDIWCRFAPDGSGGGEEHFSVWYPPADVLPVRMYATEIMAAVGGTALGGVLITRIPAGGKVKPHVDPGWHARFYEKFALQVAAAPGQEYHFEGQSLVTEPGDLYWFDNSHTHWVTNDSEQDRITAIFCIRVERETQP